MNSISCKPLNADILPLSSGLRMYVSSIFHKLPNADILAMVVLD